MSDLKIKRVLLLDDDLFSLTATSKILSFAGYEVISMSNPIHALEWVQENHLRLKNKLDLIVTDIRMPEMNGIDFFKALRVLDQKLPVILMTAYGEIDDAIWALKFGAIDFLTKPFKRQVLLDSVGLALSKNSEIHSQNFQSEQESLILGQSAIIQKIKKQISQIAPTEASVLIYGESGVGKERVAQSLHQLSKRADAPFVALNCGAIPEALIESELFGYDKGAFTGAQSNKKGLFESAHLGTLFLDEIGDIPLSLQVKLLRVLQEREYTPVGSVISKKIDVRIVAATNQDLKKLIELGSFREDLFFRLNVVELNIPPLRERLEDCELFVRHFLSQYSAHYGKKIQSISFEAMQALKKYYWPGNVRELQNVMERAVVMCDGIEVELSHLSQSIQANHSSTIYPNSTIEVPLGIPLKKVEDIIIQKTLEATAGDKNMTARILGIHSRTIYRRIQKDQ